MSRSERVSADLPRRTHQVLELAMIVAERAGNGRAPCQILGDEWLDHRLLELALKVQHVKRDIQLLSHAPRIIDIAAGAAAAFYLCRRGVILGGVATLVPELHGEAHDAT